MIIRAFGHAYDIDFRLHEYKNGQTCVAVLEEGCPFGKLTFSEDNIVLAEDEILVKTWSENKPWYDQILEHSAFTDTGRLVTIGDYDAIGEVWKLDRSKL